MSRYTELSIKAGMPRSDDAIAFLRDSLPRLRRQGYGCVLVIHGYGSTGRGGIICQEARRVLSAMEKDGRIRAAIPGEDFTLFNFRALEMKNRYPELEPLLRICNHGITAVEL